jgi:predicted O-methyltransferase YrrM
MGLPVVLSILFFAVSSKISAELPKPYDTVEVLPFDEQGWFSNAEPLKECFLEKNIQTVIEVGTWLGSSARFFGREVGTEGKVYCVDNWTGPINPTAKELAAYNTHRDRLPTLYQQFLSNVIHANLTDRIVPVRMDSLEAAKQLNVFADLIYIDAAHSEEAVFSDILAWAAHLNPDGILCGDDWHWDEVRKGVERGAMFLGKNIDVRGGFWRLRSR